MRAVIAGAPFRKMCTTVVSPVWHVRHHRKLLFRGITIVAWHSLAEADTISDAFFSFIVLQNH